MTEQGCRVCRSPLEPGAPRCGNCGATRSLEQAPAGVATPQGSSKSLPVAGGMVIALMVAAAVGFVALQQAPEREPTPSRAVERVVPVPQESARGEASAPSDVVEESSRLRERMDQELEEIERRAAQGPVSTERATLRFGARVVSAKDQELAKGSRCAINLSVTGHEIEDVDVSCGKSVLYDSRVPLEGRSSLRLGLYERPRGNGWVYRAVYWDTGSRTSRSQLLLDTPNEEATAFREGRQSFSVELVVDEFSATRVGPSLMDTGPTPKRLERKVGLRSQSGTPPVAALGRCTLITAYVETSEEGPRCKTELACGRNVLYGTGTTGFGPCAIEGGTITDFQDPNESHEDGDPSLEVALGEGTVTLSDSPRAGNYSLVFALSE